MANVAAGTKVAAAAAAGQPKKRTFRKFSYRGVDLDALLDMSTDDLVQLLPARGRRRFQRGLKRRPLALIRKLRKAIVFAFGDVSTIPTPTWWGLLGWSLVSPCKPLVTFRLGACGVQLANANWTQEDRTYTAPGYPENLLTYTLSWFLCSHLLHLPRSSGQVYNGNDQPRRGHCRCRQAGAGSRAPSAEGDQGREAEVRLLQGRQGGSCGDSGGREGRATAGGGERSRDGGGGGVPGAGAGGRADVDGGHGAEPGAEQQPAGVDPAGRVRPHLVPLHRLLLHPRRRRRVRRPLPLKSHHHHHLLPPACLPHP